MEPTNREQRRHPEKLEQLERGAALPPDAHPTAVPGDEVRGRDRTVDDRSARAKSSGHGKKTADKWNQ